MRRQNEIYANSVKLQNCSYRSRFFPPIVWLRASCSCYLPWHHLCPQRLKLQQLRQNSSSLMVRQPSLRVPFETQWLGLGSGLADLFNFRRGSRPFRRAALLVSEQASSDSESPPYRCTSLNGTGGTISVSWPWNKTSSGTCKVTGHATLFQGLYYWAWWWCDCSFWG